MAARTKVPQGMNIAPPSREAVEQVAKAQEEKRTALVEGKTPANGANQAATGAEEKVSVTEPPEAAEPAKGLTIDSVEVLRKFVKEKPATQQMSIRVPKALYDDLKLVEKFTNVTMTDAIVRATTPLVAQLLADIGKGRDAS